MFENIALPTPGFSDAPMTAMDLGVRKIFFDCLASSLDAFVVNEEASENGD